MYLLFFLGFFDGTFSPVICKYLPQLHAITGCDTTSYFYRAGTINPLKRVLKSSDCLQLLAGLGKELFDDEFQLDAMKFIKTILYCGTDEEDYVSTRVRLYKKFASIRSRSKKVR